MSKQESMPVPAGTESESGKKKYSVLVRNGDEPIEREIEIDESPEETAQFGVFPGQELKDYPGGSARVVGVHDGVLYVQTSPDAPVSPLYGRTKDDFERYYGVKGVGVEYAKSVPVRDLIKTPKQFCHRFMVACEHIGLTNPMRFVKGWYPHIDWGMVMDEMDKRCDFGQRNDFLERIFANFPNSYDFFAELLLLLGGVRTAKKNNYKFGNRSSIESDAEELRKQLESLGFSKYDRVVVKALNPSDDFGREGQLLDEGYTLCPR